MLTALSRYGARVIRNTEQIIAECRRRGELVRGPEIAEFERSIGRLLNGRHAVSASYGRMAFHYILKALDFPPGSEIIVPALTFWVIPEMVRAAGLTPVFADIDPASFNLDPQAFERAITPRTRAVVPTHLYGLPCDMDAILEIAWRRNLLVIEDCAHALGARYRGRMAGTLGDAAFFSFQTLKPLNTYGGGMAVLAERKLARRVAELAQAEPWPDEQRLLRRLRIGRLQRIFVRPSVFTWTAFPILWAASWLNWKPDVYLWEKIRRLDPLPAGYREHYTNVQAAIGLAGLACLGEWTAATREHAAILREALEDLPQVVLPAEPPERFHVYYQFCAYVADRDGLVRRSIRRGLDIETLHVDVCTRLPLFQEFWTEAPHADCAAEAVQLPVYASLTPRQVRRAAGILWRTLSRSTRAAAGAELHLKQTIENHRQKDPHPAGR